VETVKETAANVAQAVQERLPGGGESGGGYSAGTGTPAGGGSENK
jgi:hypothetical protein